ncbi:uncharacterized protein LOC130996854 isoform X1 [Salvia miltiorrhiza]|uniref:uncharacterized protein LOC130996854 isoform X1 n=1 Tax=Salvia miltiorrhiza TaxID=226208 RepID=UPI0025ACC6B3|nr:uncharacterized protein LOC130996854 isoform X1 [Salvia miltiorrhiza]
MCLHLLEKVASLIFTFSVRITFHHHRHHSRFVNLQRALIQKALHKCEKILAELKLELCGTSTAACDQYSEVELRSAAAARIVTQDDVNEYAALGRIFILH